MSHNVEDMSVLKYDIENAVGKCNCVHGNNSITFRDCYDAIKRIKHSKSEVCTGILSDHIINAGNRLACYLAFLFTSILCHGSSPGGMLLGTIIPLPKGKWIKLYYSDNYRAITLSSIFWQVVRYYHIK